MVKAYKMNDSAPGFSNGNKRDALRSFVWLSGAKHATEKSNKKAKY